MWIDDVPLVDLGADPCQAAVWAARGAVPDGEIDFGQRCWSSDGGDDTLVEPDVRDAWARDRAPALRVVFGHTMQPPLVTSRAFSLPAGSNTLTLRTRASDGPLLYAQLLDTNGALVAPSRCRPHSHRSGGRPG